MHSKLVLSLQANTQHAMLEQIIKAEFTKAPILEIRADFLQKSELTFENIKLIRDASKKQMIFTLRKKSEGGFCTLTEDERLTFYKKAIHLGYDFIDVEYTSKEIVQKLFEIKHNTKIILSYHNFRNTDPMDIAENYLSMCSQQPDIIKIATMANQEDDNEIVQKLLEGHTIASTTLTCYCIGELGKRSRISGLKNSNTLTYVATAKNKKTSPGQFTYEELLQLKK